jgi:hypothetical protein
MIATATEDADGQSDEATVRDGTHYKGSGLFIAPHSGFGRLVGRYELRGFAKWVLHLPGTEGLTAFDALYVGASISQRR